LAYGGAIALFSTAALAAPITLSYSTSLDHAFGGLPYMDQNLPGLPPASGILPSFFAPLSRLHPALAPLLQQVEVTVSASSVNRTMLQNQAPIDRTLTYALSDTLTLQLTDPLLPAIGPVSGAATSHSNPVNVSAFFSQFAAPVAGSSLGTSASFTGAQAQQFAGSGDFVLEFFTEMTFGVSGTPDPPTLGYRENGTAYNDLAGTARVIYYLAPKSAGIPAPTTLALVTLGALGLVAGRRRRGTKHESAS
jgi:hypothetical protein